MDLLEKLTQKRILVGIPAEKADRQHKEGSPLNNASIAYLVNNGSPANNIPPRPFMEKGIKAANKRNASLVAAMMKAVFAGDEAEAEQIKERIGLNTQNAIKSEIANGSYTPLALSTIRNRIRRTRNKNNTPLTRQQRSEIMKQEAAQRSVGDFSGVKNSAGNQLYKPLLDTGEMAGKITYVIEE
ncbi:hypothetical protein [Entomobacter blattae]|uniref:Uncharacterized protein n=1 Tax=Entomobacter blattae TaxID=2762277 RepID=A0A7H1NTZ1_9PROT|nr:hypothetical protein [Entomobacter blattae]QNT79251.1 hypothetical protein JGUZn3_20460 [Entomobacter blattae]